MSNDKERTIAECLGISEERDRQLYEISKASFMRHDKLSDIILDLASRITNPIELGRCCMNCGINVGMQQDHSIRIPLGGISLGDTPAAGSDYEDIFPDLGN